MQKKKIKLLKNSFGLFPKDQRNSMSFLNDIAMKYRYEKMKLTQIASLIDPNAQEKHTNLFERLSNKGHHIDKDIQISQQILFDFKVKRLSQGQLHFNPFLLMKRPKLPSHDDEIARKGFEIAEFYKNKVGRNREKDIDKFFQKNSTFDSLIEFMNDLNEKEPIEGKTDAVIKKNKKKGLNEKAVHSFTQANFEEKRRGLSKPLILNTETKRLKTSNEKKEKGLNSNCLKMTKNLALNTGILPQSFETRSLSKNFLPFSPPFSSNKPKKTSLSRIKAANDSLTSFNLFSQLSSQDTSSADDQRKTHCRITNPIARNLKPLVSFSPVNYHSSQRKKELKQSDNKEEQLYERYYMSKLREIEKIKRKNLSNSQRYQKEKKERENVFIQTKLEEIDGVHQGIFDLFNKFETDFDRKINRIKRRKEKALKLSAA